MLFRSDIGMSLRILGLCLEKTDFKYIDRDANQRMRMTARIILFGFSFFSNMKLGWSILPIATQRRLRTGKGNTREVAGLPTQNCNNTKTLKWTWQMEDSTNKLNSDSALYEAGYMLQFYVPVHIETWSGAVVIVIKNQFSDPSRTLHKKTLNLIEWTGELEKCLRSFSIFVPYLDRKSVV